MLPAHRILSLLLCALPLVAAGRNATAAEVDTALAAIESGLNQIERSSRITEQVNFDTLLDRYRIEIQKHYDQTFQAVQDEARRAEAARRPTAAAAGAKLQAWENQMAAHRFRLEKIVSRLTVTNMKVRDGRILYAPELLKKLPEEEVDELRKWLTPEAIRRYQALDKSLFAAGPARGADFARLAAQQLALPADCSACRPRSQSPWDWLGELLEPAEAEAAIAAGCVVFCTSGGPAGCVACVAAAAGGALLAQQLEVALNDCNRRRTALGRAICKSAVILGFIATIA